MAISKMMKKYETKYRSVKINSAFGKNSVFTGKWYTIQRFPCVWKSQMYYRSRQLEFVYQQDKHYPRHNHANHYVLGFILEGALELADGANSTLYQQDEYFVLAPFQVHEIKPSTEKCYRLLSICIHKTAVQNDLRQKINAMAGKLPFPKASVLNAAIKTLLQHRSQPSRAANALMQSYQKGCASMPSARYARKHLGLTPCQLRLQYRIRLAQRLMETAMPLTEVALRSGFYDQSHFIKTFRQWVGVTPRAYRASVYRLSFNKVQGKTWQTKIAPLQMPEPHAQPPLAKR
jgi:hypothetical protein